MTITSIIILIIVIVALILAVKFIVKNVVTIILGLAILVGLGWFYHSSLKVQAQSTATHIAEKSMETGKEIVHDFTK